MPEETKYGQLRYAVAGTRPAQGVRALLDHPWAKAGTVIDLTAVLERGVANANGGTPTLIRCRHLPRGAGPTPSGSGLH
jgi:hypothetical protein